MTTLALNGFTSQFTKGGARANQFEVKLTPPSGVSITGSDTFSFYIKAASLPGNTIEEIAVNYRGRILYLDGDRTFDTWTTTVINDTDFAVRNGLEKWMNTINNLNTNVSIGGSAAGNITTYMGDLTVTQFGRGAENEVLKEYKLLKCWPTVIAPIELSWDTRNEIETFDVTWRYTEFVTKFERT
jgi:hypothetical protein